MQEMKIGNKKTIQKNDISIYLIAQILIWILNLLLAFIIIDY